MKKNIYIYYEYILYRILFIPCNYMYFFFINDRINSFFKFNKIKIVY